MRAETRGENVTALSEVICPCFYWSVTLVSITISAQNLQAPRWYFKVI